MIKTLHAYQYSICYPRKYRFKFRYLVYDKAVQAKNDTITEMLILHTHPQTSLHYINGLQQPMLCVYLKDAVWKYVDIKI